MKVTPWNRPITYTPLHLGRACSVLDRVHDVRWSAVHVRRLCADVRSCVPRRLPLTAQHWCMQSASCPFSRRCEYDATAVRVRYDGPGRGCEFVTILKMAVVRSVHHIGFSKFSNRAKFHRDILNHCRDRLNSECRPITKLDFIRSRFCPGFVRNDFAHMFARFGANNNKWSE